MPFLPHGVLVISYLVFHCTVPSHEWSLALLTCHPDGAWLKHLTCGDPVYGKQEDITLGSGAKVQWQLMEPQPRQEQDFQDYMKAQTCQYQDRNPETRWRA